MLYYSWNILAVEDWAVIILSSLVRSENGMCQCSLYCWKRACRVLDSAEPSGNSGILLLSYMFSRKVSISLKLLGSVARTFSKIEKS